MEVNQNVKKQYFTCIGKGHGAPCLSATREDWERLRREPWLAEMCQRIENGDEELKHRLPVWTPHCAEFRGNHRAAADAVKPLPRLMMDFDEKGHTDEIKAKLMAKSPLEVLLIEESVRRGTHVLVELPVGMSAEQAQELMASATGFKPDAAVKDVSRCIYMVTEGHTRYVSAKLFEAPETQAAEAHGHEAHATEAYAAVTYAPALKGTPSNLEGESVTTVGAESVAGANLGGSKSAARVNLGSGKSAAGVNLGSGKPAAGANLGGDKSAAGVTNSPSKIEGVPFRAGAYEPPRSADRAGAYELPRSDDRPEEYVKRTECAEPAFKGIPYQDIISEWWRRNGGEPAEGERNVKLHKLAVNLRAICDNKREVLMNIMPRFGLTDAELKSVVDSACKEEPKGVSKVMQSIIDALERGINSDEVEDAEAVEGETGVKVNVRALPMGLKESLVGVPVSMHLPVLCSVLPIAAAYADQVEVEYCDGNRQRLGLMSIIRGEQASGKSVCKNAVDIWKRQFDEEDALARKREEEWKERKKSRKANEKAPDDPKVLIRMVPVTVSCSTLLKRFKNANGHCLYSFGEELDTLRKTNGAGSWSSKYDIYRLSFDQGEWGQDYNSDQAESGVVKVAYNWTMLGTNGAMRKCFKSDNIENGLSSRILVAEMPDSSFSKMPKYGRRSTEDEVRIQEAVTRLRSYSGLIDTPRLRKAIEDWVEQKRVEAAKDIDHVKDTYRKRAAVIGFRCGVIFHMLSLPSIPSKGRGSKETKACLDFALMMAEYCLQQQIKAFGEVLQSQYVDAGSECQRYGANNSIFDQLAPTFTMDDLSALKRSNLPRNSIVKIISRWKRDGWIEKVDTSHWSKTKNDKVTMTK